MAVLSSVTSPSPSLPAISSFPPSSRTASLLGCDGRDGSAGDSSFGEIFKFAGSSCFISRFLGDEAVDFETCLDFRSVFLIFFFFLAMRLVFKFMLYV